MLFLYSINRQHSTINILHWNQIKIKAKWEMKITFWLFFFFLLRHFSLNRSLGEFRQLQNNNEWASERESKLNLHDTLLNTDLFLIAWLHDIVKCIYARCWCSQTASQSRISQFCNCLWELLKVTDKIPLWCAMNHAKIFQKKNSSN